MRKIQYEVAVKAEPEQVWEAFTTEEGARTFFGRDARIDLRIGGRYEIWFNPQAEEGLRGGDGCKVLSFLPGEMLSFTWNAPPSIPTVRSLGCASWVVIELSPLPERLTQVRLTHLGWQEGADWEQTYNYFVDAWKVVLAQLVNRFLEGPIRWAPLEGE